MTNKKNKQPKRYGSIGKIQEIKWLDHSSHKSWDEHKPVDPYVSAITIGRVISEDDTYVQLAATHSPEDSQLAMIMNIIKSCIIKRRTLK